VLYLILHSVLKPSTPALYAGESAKIKA
jgi:hypothetical protein